MRTFTILLPVLQLLAFGALAVLSAKEPKPKPLSAEDRAKVLATAVATQQAELSLHRLERQYQETRARLEQDLQAKIKVEQVLFEELQRSSNAVGCTLSADATQWQCSKSSKESKESKEGNAK